MLVPIEIPPGLVRGGTPYDMPGQWWDMNLMRFVAGVARPVGGWARQTSTPLDSAIRRFHAWENNDGTRAAMVGTDHKLYVDYGGWIDVTPTGIVPPTVTMAGGYGSGPYGAGTYGTARPAGESTVFAPRYATWSFANWGQDVLLLSSEDNRIFHYITTSPTTPPVALDSGDPLNPVPLANAVAVTDERHVMVVGPVIDGTYLPNAIAWSSAESLTDWNFESLTNSAGFLPLQTTSPLNWIIKVREGMLVFSSTEVFLISFAGPPYYYVAQKIAEMPIFHPYTITSFGNGRAMWFSPRAFQLYAGNQVQPLVCPIFHDIIDDVDNDWGPLRSHISGYGLFPEVWFFWPSGGKTECDRYAIYNYMENTFAWGYLNRSAMITAGALRRPLAGTEDGIIYEHENGWTDAGYAIGQDRWLETGALGLQNGQNLLDVKQALLSTTDPFHSGTDNVLLQFFARYTPDGPETVYGPYTPRADGYTDVRVSCREARVRFIGNYDRLFDVGLLRLDVSPTGGRR